MPVVLERDGTKGVIRLDGDVDITSAAELKRILIDAISSSTNVHVDLTSVTDLDVTAIQLLWSASREAKKHGTPFGTSANVSDNLICLVREAGFGDFPVPLAPDQQLEKLAISSTEGTDD